MQPHDIGFAECNPIVSDLLQVLQQDVKQCKHLSALQKSLRQEGGICTFHGIRVEFLHKIKEAVVDENQKQLFNREVLDKLGWLNLNEWPQNDNLTIHGKANVEAIFEH